MAAPVSPGCAVLGHGGPALVVNAAIARHLEILGLVPFVSFRIIEGIGHADAFDRALLDPVDEGWLGQTRHFQKGRRKVDEMMQLAAQFAPGFDPVRPVDDGAVSGTAKMRGDLFGPLIGRVHRMRR